MLQVILDFALYCCLSCILSRTLITLASNLFSITSVSIGEGHDFEACILSPVIEEIVYSSGYTTVGMNKYSRYLHLLFALICINYGEPGDVKYILFLITIGSFIFSEYTIMKLISGITFGLRQNISDHKYIGLYYALILIAIYGTIYWYNLYISTKMRQKYGTYYGYLFVFLSHISINTYLTSI